MEELNKAINNSVKHTSKVISDSQYYIISLINYIILSDISSALGSVANVINMIVFYRQGLDSTINISFFSLAISDLCSLVFQQLFNVYINPLFLNLDLPIVHTEIQFHTTAIPREIFARITCLITAFITAERCLCVVYPLHVKRLITPGRTIIVISAIYTLTLISPAPVYFTSYYTWIFHSDLNRTLLGLAFTSHHSISGPMLYFTHSFFTLSGFLSVLIFTLILTYKLRQKSAWRQTANADQDKSKSMSKRDRAAIKIVILIAGILVVCYTPAAVIALTTLLVPEMSIGGRLSNVYHSCWSIAMLFESINSSVNIFLYYQMSTKYRETFRELFSRCLQSENKALTE